MLTLRIPAIPKPDPEPAEPPRLDTPAPRPALSASRFARGLTVLSVAWLHGRFEAVAIQRGEVSGTWEHPEAQDEPGRFGDLLKEAVARTGYRGTTVTLLLAHPRLTQQLMETPPAKGTALQSLVRRQVERMKVFDGQPAWTHQPALPTKNSQSVLVHLLPQEFVDQFVQGAQRIGLRLLSVTPCTAVLHGQFARLGLKSDELALIAADTHGMTTILVGRADGQVVLARVLDAGRGRGTAELAVDLNRTLLFVSQQYGAPVGSVWLFGPGLTGRLAEIQAQVQVPVRESPDAHRPCYWSEEAACLTSLQAPNLINHEQRKAPQRRVLMRMTLLLALVVLAGAVATVGFCETLVRREKANAQALRKRLTDLETQHQGLQRTHLQLERQTAFAAQVIDGRLAPVPLWFLGYLSEALPPELVVTQYLVRRENERWSVRLDGTSRAATSSAADPGDRAPLEILTERLRSGPFHLHVGGADPGLDAAIQEPVRSPVESIALWAARLASRSEAGAPAASGGTFHLEGVMQ